MSRKKIRKRNIVDKYKCLQCEHNWEEKRKNGPYWGYGWNKYGKKSTPEEDDNEDWYPKEPTCPEHLPCPKCGYYYYTRV